jgi:hypothetical protein
MKLDEAEAARIELIKEQLKELRKACEKNGNKVDEICCDIALSAMSAINLQHHPARSWGDPSPPKNNDDDNSSS